MLVSRKATSRRSVHWPIVVATLCVVMPAIVGMAQTTTPVTYQITYELQKDTQVVSPNPYKLTNVHTGDTVIFYNASSATIKITPDKVDALEGLSTNNPDITLDPGQLESRKVTLKVEKGIYVELPAKPTGSETTAGTKPPQMEKGPGMQVNP